MTVTVGMMNQVTTFLLIEVLVFQTHLRYFIAILSPWLVAARAAGGLQIIVSDRAGSVFWGGGGGVSLPSAPALGQVSFNNK